MEGRADSQQEFMHSATFLPLKSWLHMVPFQLMTLRVLRQAKQSAGMVDYAVRADFPKKHFWTMSVWEDRASMRRFVMAEPHATAMKKFEKWAGEGSAFVEWTSPRGAVDWEEAMERLKSPSFYYRRG